MKENGGKCTQEENDGDGKGADVGAIADTDVDTKKGQLYERQW